MTGKIKLNAASGGGSVSFQAPSSTGDDRVITLPTTADGTVLTTTNPKAGNIIQVVSTTKTDTASSSINASSNYTAHGVSVNITPTSSSNKIYINGQISVGMSPNDAIMLKLNKGGSVLSGAVGDAASSRTQITASGEMEGDFALISIPFQFLDTAGATSQLTYAIGLSISNTGSYTVYVNRSHTDSDASSYGRAISVITAMEVAA